MSTPESNAPDFNSIMEGIQSGKIGLTADSESAPEATFSEEEAPEELEASTEETEQEESSELSASEQEDSEPLEAESADESPSEDAIEVISVTDAKGRRDVKVDFSDRDKLKKYVQLAHGGRKWQRERDEARTELSQIKPEYDSLKADWTKVEQAYQQSGVAGLVDLLEGKEGAFDNWYEQERDRREAFASMSDSDRRAYEREQEASKRDSESQKLREEYEAKLAEIQKERDVNETRALESKLHPSFDRYRFTGKLGDEVAEHHYDQALWNQALSNLDELPEDVEITQSMIDREFRKVAGAFRKVINKQVETNTKKAVENKKRTAATKAAAKAGRGIKQNSDLEDMRNSMKSGNIVDSLNSFFKSGGRFN